MINHVGSKFHYNWNEPLDFDEKVFDSALSVFVLQEDVKVAFEVKKGHFYLAHSEPGFTLSRAWKYYLQKCTPYGVLFLEGICLRVDVAPGWHGRAAA